MKFLPLIWSGIWRKRGRTILIFLQVSVAFSLFGVLQGMKTGVDEAIAKTRADVLGVGPSAFGGLPLPVGYLNRLSSIPGVKAVTFADGLLGTYQKPTQHVYVNALEPSNIWLTLAPEFLKVLPKDLDALHKTRTGVLITADLANKYGWHVGDRIPLTSTTLQSNGSGNWVFDVVGTFTVHDIASDYIVANYAYLDESRARNKATVRKFFVVATDPKNAPMVADTIDQTFANSSDPTATSSFQEDAQQSMKSIGDLNFAIRSIVSAVLVALLFAVTTMMMQTIRERTPELAVLKTLGFTDRAIFLLVVTEAVMVCVAAALTGLTLAMVAFPYASKFVPGLSMPIVVIEAGVIGAVLVALISVALPAARAARLRVVDGLAGR